MLQTGPLSLSLIFRNLDAASRTLDSESKCVSMKTTLNWVFVMGYSVHNFTPLFRVAASDEDICTSNMQCPCSLEPNPTCTSCHQEHLPLKLAIQVLVSNDFERRGSIVAGTIGIVVVLVVRGDGNSTHGVTRTSLYQKKRRRTYILSTKEWMWVPKPLPWASYVVR